MSECTRSGAGQNGPRLWGLVGPMLLFALAACTAPGQVNVARGKVAIVAPPGYCIDLSALHNREDGSFVLLASCATLSPQAETGQAVLPAMLTASVSAQNDVEFGRSYRLLRRYVRSPAGRAALARDGNARSVRILSTRRINDTLLLKVRDRSPALAPALQRDYWRAVFALNGRLISLSVFSFADHALRNSEARAILMQFVQRVRAANVAPAPTPER